jgi:hypothetical protein
MRRLIAALLVVAVTRPVFAQELDPAAAEVLFVAGRKAMDAGDYATACGKLAESQRLDPAAGTLNNLADCFDKRGHVASAWQKWREARGMLRPGDDRLWAVEDRIQKIEGRLPRLTITVEPGAPEGTTVYRDDVLLRSASFGVALPVDPGAHAVRVEAPGREVEKYDVELAEGQRVSLSVGPGVEKVEASPVAVLAPSSPDVQPQSPSPRPPPADSVPSRSSPWTGYVIGGAGVVLLGVGAVAGALAAGKKSVMDDACIDRDGTLRCSQEGLEAAESGRTLATLANVGVTIGIVGVGVGAFLILSHDDGTTSTVSARPTAGGAGMAFSRSF